MAPHTSSSSSTHTLDGGGDSHPRLAVVFRGTSRFRLVRELGSGGMGVVYEAHDQLTGSRVALKTLLVSTPELLLRLKREFRSLADVRHPGLVSMGELIEEDGTWFFTMELLSGVPLLEHVRPDAASAPETADTLRFEPRVERPPIPPEGLPDLRRLRPALAQLAEALGALHDAGHVHRDVKPSNVMVTREGRVVLLDFGLVTERDELGHGWTGEGMMGTALYMAPEQVAGGPVGAAADFYALGAILFEALTGRPPFVGPPLAVMTDKQRLRAPRASDLAPGVPPELDSLAAALLARDPAARPSLAEILRCLAAHAHTPPHGMASSQLAPFVGRRAELDALHRALGDVRAGVAVEVSVEGESGIGKSALVRRFVASAAGPDVLVLAGRCYEREAVPYKAIDGVVDALAAALQRMPPGQADAVVPRRASVLAAVFPVLRRVAPIMSAPPVGTLEPQELRQRMFSAVRELMERLAERYTVIVAIDDFHWADADSLALLAELLREPEAPPILLVTASRPVERGHPTVRADARSVTLGPLARRESRELASRLLAEDSGDAVSQAIADESEGHPLFLDALVRDAMERAGASERGEISRASESTPLARRLEDVLRARIARLDPRARRVLELVVTAGRPIERQALARASLLDLAELAEHVDALRAQRFVATMGPHGAHTVETFHDRVRVATLATLEPDALRARHLELARALEAADAPDSVALFVHLRGAGASEEAARHAVDAARAAARALAFDRASTLFRAALELLGDAHPDAAELAEQLGDALANAGRGADAALAYETAAHRSSAARALELRGRAARQLLVTGHIDRGIGILSAVLTAEHLAYPRTPLWALLMVLAYRVLLGVRGLSFTPRDASEIAPRELARIDLCWTGSASLGIVDNVRGNAFHVRGLLLALRAGEPVRLSRALAIEACFTAAQGGRSEARVEHLLAMADRLAAESGDRLSAAIAMCARGHAAFLAGRFASALEICDRTHAVLRDECVGATWETNTVRLWAVRSLLFMGRMRELAARASRGVAECTDRGDLYGGACLRLSALPFVRLAEDDPEEALYEVDEALERWSVSGYHVQHYYALYSRASAALYAGRGHVALADVEAAMPRIRRAFLSRVQMIRVVVHDLRARAALATAEGSVRAARLRTARSDAARIEREGLPWTTALASGLTAMIALAEGQDERAADRLAIAALHFDAAGMALHAAAMRHRRGELLGGAAGRVLVQDAEASMRAESVRAPARMVRMLAPQASSSSRSAATRRAF